MFLKEPPCLLVLRLDEIGDGLVDACLCLRLAGEGGIAA